ncbi:MAG: rhomboid family intramembrane serine protease [Cyanobacteriota bacterium]|nr:rhomboid family intramembrane serine protease [Cyanobacteriota bacterium]
MIPLHDENPTENTPYIVYGLVGLNIAIFLFQMSLSEPQLLPFLQTWAVVPRELTASFAGRAPIGEWLTLVSSQFLHGGIFHLGGNMLFLWVFGNNIEDRLGPVKFIVFYLACGIAAALTQWFFSMNSTVPLVGASGAIAGVMGAYILKFPRTPVVTLVPLGFFITTVRLPAYFFLGIWFLQQAFFSFVSLNAAENVAGGGVAYWAHAGGFVVGMALAPVLGLFEPHPLD